MLDSHPHPDGLTLRSTRRRLTWIPVTLVSLSLTAFAAGCGNDSSPQATAGSAPAASAAGSPASGAEKPARAGKPAGGGAAAAAAKRQPRPTIKAARKAVDTDNYAAATGIAASLPKATRSAVRKRVSNRLGRRARVALKAGNRSLVLSLLAEAKRYPKTDLMRDVRADYLAAERAFEARGEKRLLDRRQRTRLAKAQREAARARARAEAS